MSEPLSSKPATIDPRSCPNGCGPLEPYASTPIGDFGPWGCPACHYIEQRTSNPPCDPVVWRFICAVFPEAPNLALASFNEKHALITAAETIERLTAELDEALKLNPYRKKWVEVKADNYWLRAAVNALHDHIHQLMDPHDAGAAVETISICSAHRVRDPNCHLCNWTGRPADETKPAPYKCNMGEGCPNPTHVPHWHE